MAVLIIAQRRKTAIHFLNDSKCEIWRSKAAKRYKPINENVEYPIHINSTDRVSPNITSKKKM